MSSWTYVSGVVEADTFAQTNAEAIFKAQTVVDHLPQITGSEGPAHFVVTPVPGWHNWSSGTDELRHPSNLGKGRRGSFETQTGVLLVLCGKLRDRYFSATLEETTRCLARLAARLSIQNCLVRVSGYDRQYIFDSPSWICNMPSSGWKTRLVNWGSIPKSDATSPRDWGPI